MTEREPSESLPGESDQRFRSLVENTAAPVGITDPTGDFTYVNKALADLVGYTVQELVGRPFMDFLHPQDREVVLGAFMKGVSTSEEAPEIEFRVTRRDGQILTLTSKPTRFEIAGKTVGFQAIITDITERKRAEHRGAKERALSRAMSIVFERALTCATEDELGSTCLTMAEELTGSKFGFIGEVNEAGRMDTIALSDPGWEACRIPETHAVRLIRNMEVRGIWGRVLKDERAMIVNDPATHPDRVGPPQGHPPLSSFLGVPLKHAGKTLGIIALANKGAGYDHDDLEALETLSAAVVQAFMRKRAEIVSRRRANELAALHATVLDITAQRDLPTLLQTVVERAAQLLDAHGGGLYICDPEKQEVRCVVSYNTGRDYTGLVLRYGEGAAGIVAQTGKPLMIDDYRIWRGRAAAYEEDKPFTAVLSAPMIWRDHVTGVIHILEDVKTRHFTQRDLNLLTLFANHAAIVVENTRLLEQEKRHAEELTRYSTNLEHLVLERTGKLAESERRFRELSDLLPQIIFEIDENGNVQYMNRAGFAATGLSEEGISKGLNAFRFLAPAEHGRATRGIRRVIAGEMIGEREFTVLRRDGTTFPTLVYTAPITREGKSVGLRGIAVDITDRKRAEEELRAAKEQLDYVVTSNPAVLFTGKPRPDLSNFDATYLSKSVVSLLGFEPENYVEMWYDRVHPEDVRRYLAEVPLLWKDGRHTFEYRFLHKDGSYRWIREEAKVIRDAGDKPVEVMGYWSDVTERKRLEARLAESQRLAGIGEAAAMVGHDLRNPLQGIVSTVYLAKRKLESSLESSREAGVKPGLVDMLETIENEAEYMGKIVSDLQDYAAPLKAEPEPVIMEPLVKDTLSKIRIPRNVKVSFKVGEPLPTVMIDSAVMRRVFMNLITNAIQAMPNGGELTIDLSRIDEHLLVSFRDTGVGIPEENMGKLFNPFFTTKAKGQGLGLPVCKKLVEANDGRITIESKPGEGSTFTVKLPIIKP